MNATSLVQLERWGMSVLGRGTITRCPSRSKLIPGLPGLAISSSMTEKTRLPKCFSTTSANALDIGGIFPPIPTPFVSSLDDDPTAGGLI